VEKTFADRKIDVKVNSRVVGVGKNTITVIDSSNKQQEIPFGLAVWTTGIGTSPLVTKLREKLTPQTNRRALLTDSNLKVKGSTNIYAMGDCATIEQDLMVSKMEEIFTLGDTDGDGLLSIVEFKSLVKKQSRKYPQLEFFGDKIEELFHKHDTNKDSALSREEFRELIKIVDSKCTSLPPTAQVASQEGKYLAHLFNADKSAVFPPFKYHHLFSIANIGDNKAVIDAGKYSISGLGAWYLWKSVYLSKQYSFNNKLAIAGNWLNTSLFGRKITRE
jgi:NADH dehydrogenase FAD-containing subunit